MSDDEAETFDNELLRVQNAVKLLREQVTDSSILLDSYSDLQNKLVIADERISSLSKEIDKAHFEIEERETKNLSSVSTYESIIHELNLSLSEKKLSKDFKIPVQQRTRS